MMLLPLLQRLHRSLASESARRRGAPAPQMSDRGDSGELLWLLYSHGAGVLEQILSLDFEVKGA